MLKKEKEMNINSPVGGQGAFFLIGFMGSGKTYWGKKWSEKIGKEFFDTDEIIEQQQGITIAKIFATDGENHFRNLETEILKNMSLQNNLIIACGGGTPCFNDNITWMNQNGTSVYLQSSPENISKRLMSEKEKRPLIKHLNDEELLFYITEKIKEREVFYQQAEKVINVDDLPENYLPEFLKL